MCNVLSGKEEWNWKKSTIKEFIYLENKSLLNIFKIFIQYKAMRSSSIHDVDIHEIISVHDLQENNSNNLYFRNKIKPMITYH